MSMKTFTVVGGLLMALGFFAGSLQGCGSSAADNKALCKKGCDKTLMCHPELAPFLMNCEAQCSMKMGTPSAPCKNESAIIAKYNECLGKACGDPFDACLMTIPDCEGGSGGTGGTTTGTGGKGGSGGSLPGTGGSTGSGGSGSDASAGGTCERCTKADACCTGIPGAADAGGCGLAAECNMAAGSDRAQVISSCDQFLMAFSQFPNAPAACK